MKQNAKFALILIPSVVAAFLAGLFIEKPQFTDNSCLGEVGKAKCTTAEYDIDGLQNRLQTDTVFLANTLGKSLMMQSQAKTLAGLIEKSQELVGGNPVFTDAIASMNESYDSVKNACSSLDLYVSSLLNLAGGKDVTNFNQVYSDAVTGYSLVSAKHPFTQLFITAAESGTELGESATVDELQELLNGWIAFEQKSNLLYEDM